MKQKSARQRVAEPRIRPVTKTSISDEIVDQIMSLIERGDLKPGQRLPSERELCVRFGAGRSSLREALRCLAIVGVLRARVGEGTSVALDSGKTLRRLLHWRLITDRQGIEHLMEVRMALESLTAASVAINRNDDDLALLDQLLQKMEDALGDHKRFSVLDLDFHLALANASGNPLVSDLISMIRGQVALGLGRVLAPPNALPLSLQEHTKIVQKIRRRDPEGARQTMYAHLQASMTRYRLSMHTAAEPGEASSVATVAARPRPAKKPGARAAKTAR
jgi:GntR family transcriptional repressor for pyruvate dehydrogenase complex